VEGAERLRPLSESEMMEAHVMKEALEELEKSINQIIAERDEAEETVNELYSIVIGHAPEWSNNFDFDDAIEEVFEAHTLLCKSLRETEAAHALETRNWKAFQVTALKDCSDQRHRAEQAEEELAKLKAD
jgi:hypothetical protein